MASLNDVQLTPNEILKKQFRSKMKGYDQEEVDSYLDKIISDYEVFAQIIEGLQKQISQLKMELNEAQSHEASTTNEVDDVKTYHPSNYQPQPVQTPADSEEITTNVAMIQRISTLERKVYNLEQRMNAQDRTYQAN